MKLAIASAAVASLLALGAFSPLALGQQLSSDYSAPAHSGFSDQRRGEAASVASASLGALVAQTEQLPEESGSTDAPRGKCQAEGDEDDADPNLVEVA